MDSLERILYREFYKNAGTWEEEEDMRICEA